MLRNTLLLIVLIFLAQKVIGNSFMLGRGKEEAPSFFLTAVWRTFQRVKSQN